MGQKKKGYNKKQRYKVNNFSGNTQMDYPIYNVLPNVENAEENLSEPVMNIDSLYKLVDYLDNHQLDNSFPEITVIPDVIKNTAKFFNERKQMKYAHQEFEKKIQFLSDGVDKQYHVAMQKLQNETEIQLMQIEGNVKQAIISINRYYDTELERIHGNYMFESEKMNLYYKELELQRKESARRFDKMIKLISIDRKQAYKVIKEAEALCNYYRKKIYNNTITREEREYYMELLKFRNLSINNIINIIPRLIGIESQGRENGNFKKYNKYIR